MSWRVYPWALASCHVTLAPLAAINPFTDGKSALKFFEAGALGVPTIATSGARARAGDRARQERLAGRQREPNGSTRCRKLSTGKPPARLGAAARESVLESHSFDAHRGKLRELLESIAVSSRPGRQPAARALAWDEYTGRPEKWRRPVPQAAARSSSRALMRVLGNARDRRSRPRAGRGLARRACASTESASRQRRCAVAAASAIPSAAAGVAERAALRRRARFPASFGATGSDPALDSATSSRSRCVRSLPGAEAARAQATFRARARSCSGRAPRRARHHRAAQRAHPDQRRRGRSHVF